MLQAIIFLGLVYLAIGFYTAGCFLEQGILHKHGISISKSLKPIYIAGIIVILWPVFIGLVVGKGLKNLIKIK